MRDYKNVKVPRKYRTVTKRTVNRRVEVGPARGRGRGGRAKEVLVAMLSVAVTLALGYGAWTGYHWVTTAEVFQIAGVDVKGARKVSDQDIREAAALFTGQNVFRVDISEAVRRASENPWVRQVRIERRLPNRISMVFEERSARAVLQAANGRFLMDGGGTVIVPARDDDGVSAGLPAIAIRGLRAEPGSGVESEALPAALELLDELALRGGWDLAEVVVRAESAETIAILYAGREFRIGRGAYPEKLRRLGEIVSDMNRRRLDYAYVELRPERQAAVMVKKESKARR